jgi:cell division protein FtsL
MIARPLRDAPETPRRRTGSRAGHGAVTRRRARSRRDRYSAVVQIVATLAVLTLCVFVYLGLMANVTRMSYELTRNAQTRAKLIDETTRLDERLEALESRERLAQIAKSLGMKESAALTVARLPQPPSAPHGGTFLAALTAWLP